MIIKKNLQTIKKTKIIKVVSLQSMSSELEKLTFTLRKLKLASFEFIHTMLPIMERIDEDHSEIIEEIKYACPDADEEDITDWLHDMTLTMIADPEKIIEEINHFTNVAAKGSKMIRKSMEKYPFLAHVWSGDMYDNKKGVEALQELLREVNENKENANENYIVDSAIDHFSK